MEQVLPYLQPAARVLSDRKAGGGNLHAFSVAASDGTPAFVLVNQDWGPLELTLALNGRGADRYSSLSVTRTERGRLGERLGRVRIDGGVASMVLPPRSITTLVPAGTSPMPETEG